MNENKDRVLKRKKPNIFQRFGHRISKYFHKSKTTNLVKDNECNLSKSCLDEIPVTSKSHDDLHMKNKFTRKRKKFGIFLNCSFAPWTFVNRRRILKRGNAKRNDRCLSEGDLTQNEGQFYSPGSSPKTCATMPYKSNINDSSRTKSNFENNSPNHKIMHSFKNELALKLRAKSQPKDSESVHSKTPDSPTGIETGTSPSRQMFGEARTPRSMSSLSHSSNSLLSGNAVNNYGTSDGESMSRSVIDSNDDIGIVVDLATPICQTTNATLLDSTAARQKIAASKARRVRPKAVLTNLSSEKISASDPKQFSPIREKRDILEEIREEDCSLSHQSRVFTDNNKLNNSSSSTISTSSKKIVNLKSVPSTKATDVVQSDSSLDELSLSQTNNTGDSNLRISDTVDRGKPIFNLRKCTLRPENEKANNAEKADNVITPRFYVKLRPTGNSALVNCSDQKPENTVLSNNSAKLSAPINDKKPTPAPSKVNRYTSLQSSTCTKSAIADNIVPIVADKESFVKPNVTGGYGDKRASRVLSMVKNFESVPCTDSH